MRSAVLTALERHRPQQSDRLGRCVGGSYVTEAALTGYFLVFKELHSKVIAVNT